MNQQQTIDRQAKRIEELEGFIVRNYSYEPYEAAMDKHDCVGHPTNLTEEDRVLIISTIKQQALTKEHADD